MTARYQALNSALLSQLDRAEDTFQYQHSLRDTVREWLGIAKDPRFPAGVHYLLERHPETLKIDLSRGAMSTVVHVLYRIASDEDIEVFLTVLDYGKKTRKRPRQEARLVHMADYHRNDIHEYFATDKQEVLQNATAFFKYGNCVEPCLPPTQDRLIAVAILPTSRALDRKNSNPGQTEHDRLRLQENMMCYLADRVLDKTDVVMASSVLEDYADGLAVSDPANPTPFRWPRRPLEKTLLNAITVGHLSLFATRAASVCYEPSPQLFEDIVDELKSYPPLASDLDRVDRGLDILLSRVKLANLLPALRCLTLLKYENDDPECANYVDKWLHDDFVESRCRSGVWFHREDAAAFVDVCTSLPDVEIDHIICDLMGRQLQNTAFCLALIAKLMEASSDRGLGTAHLLDIWDYFERFFLGPLHVRNMVKQGSCSKKTLPRFPRASSWNNRPLPSQPMDPAIPTIVGEIQFRLLQNPTGWWPGASARFNAWLEDCLSGELADNEGLTIFWLPLLRDLSLRRDRSFWESKSQVGRRWYGSFFRAVLLNYLQVGVGQEPRRRDFCRPGFSPQERDGCTSCRVLSRFLLDRSRVRAIFPVVLEHPPTTSRSRSSGYALQQNALSHMLPLLAARKRNCAFHLKDSTCGGTVLCVEKRDGSKHWEDWCRRRDDAAKEMARFDQDTMRLILGEKDYKALVGMEIAKRANREEWERELGGSIQGKADKMARRRRFHDDPDEDRLRILEWDSEMDGFVEADDIEQADWW